MDQSRIGEVLGECELFKDLGMSEIQQLAGLCHVDAYDAGAVIFQQGDYGDQLYIIAEGYVFLERSIYLEQRQGRVNIGILGKGRVFGCWSSALGEPHTIMSTARCHKPTELVVMKGADLRKIMLSHKRFGFHVLERLCLLLRDRIQGAYGALEKI